MNRWIRAAVVSMTFVASAAVAQNYVCVVDNLPMMWTGNVRTEMAVMLKEYRCVQGHTAWGR